MNNSTIKAIINTAQIVTPTGTKALKGAFMEEIKIIEDGAVLIKDDEIAFVGTKEELVQHSDFSDEIEIIDAAGKSVIPGFVDSHTHFVFGGYRPGEFMERLAGAAYLDILKKGGGIQSTVKSTRDSTWDELYHSGYQRLDSMLAQGVTTVEGKSGYGLDIDTELKQLKVMEMLNKDHVLDIQPTFLGAHAIPMGSDADEYVDFMIEKALPRMKDLSVFCDVFCEEGVFSVRQSEKLLLSAKRLGYKLKIHADEMIPLGGAELAAALGATSADHLLAASDAGIIQLAGSDTVATLLPCTAFCLGKPYANARHMIDSGCAVAIATDYNPGSCYTNSIPLLLALSVINMNMTAPEALTAITLNAAAAIAESDRIGSIQTGKKADLVILKEADYRFLFYNTAMNQIEKVIKNGKIVYQAPI